MKKDLSLLSPETRAIIRSQLSRRSLFAGAGAIAGASALAACGTGSTDSATNAVVDVSDTEKVVRWANWTYYLDYDKKTQSNPTLNKFFETTGIKATYSEDIDDNGTFNGKVLPQLGINSDIGYDLVTITDWNAGFWIEQGYAAKLDADVINNKKNIRPVLAEAGFDPGRNYSLTWASGFAGFGWNTQKLPKGVRTMEDLFAPENKGRVVVLSEMRDTMGIILQYQGVDPSTSFTEDQFMNGIEFLKGKIADGFIRKVRGNAYTEDLQNGDALAVIGWSGDILNLKEDTKGKFDFQVPESGGTLWSDNLLIPSTSAHKKNAERLMNYYYDPVVSAQVYSEVQYICPVVGAQEEVAKVNPKRAENPFIFPEQATLNNVKIFRPLSNDEQTAFQKAFDDAIGN
ncbi:MAG: spermidine/putrescine ABC transporter substrate-binding protein [Gammaproteobacteria bacterium]|nr:spermidine/putrescine ABC transporter substrate-binding protein [Gammaproteobacteria bacterium]